MRRSLPVFYDCRRCPAYCCTYPNIPVGPADVARLARRFGVSTAVARRRFTKRGSDGERVLRHQRDPVFGSACRFLDTASRRCTVYADRPANCRAYPGCVRCGYYDFLNFERRLQDDPDFVATTHGG